MTREELCAKIRARHPTFSPVYIEQLLDQAQISPERVARFLKLAERHVEQPLDPAFFVVSGKLVICEAICEVSATSACSQRAAVGKGNTDAGNR